jgi:hypothetical protein
VTSKTKEALKQIQAVTNLGQVTVELVQQLQQAANELLGPEAEHPENRKPEDTVPPTPPVGEVAKKAEFPRFNQGTNVKE